MRFRNIHVIGFEWDDFLPILFLHDGKELNQLHIADFTYIDISASKALWCIGSFHDGEYNPCPEAAMVDEFRQCQKCIQPLIPVQTCIFEPRCDGSICNVEFCRREHIVYLAFFGRLIKVGMTSVHRCRKRAIEQGTDAFTIIKRVPGRLAARTFEKHLSNLYGIPQFHSSREILSEMARKIDRDDIRAVFTRTISSVKDEISRMPELFFLDRYPIELPLRRVPVLRPNATRHRGKILGIKGKYLIYEHSGIYALDLADMVGRRINLILR